jgi:hypothetical protein
VRGEVFVVAVGIGANGPRETLGFLLADSESEANWRGFLRDLKARRLKPRRSSRSRSAAPRVCAPPYGRFTAQAGAAPPRAQDPQRASDLQDTQQGAASLRARARSGPRRTAARPSARSRPSPTNDGRGGARSPRSVAISTSVCPIWTSMRPTPCRSGPRTCSNARFREVRRRTRPVGPYANTASADWVMFGLTDQTTERWRGVPQVASTGKLTDLTQGCYQGMASLKAFPDTTDVYDGGC